MRLDGWSSTNRMLTLLGLFSRTGGVTEHTSVEGRPGDEIPAGGIDSGGRLELCCILAGSREQVQRLNGFTRSRGWSANRGERRRQPHRNGPAPATISDQLRSAGSAKDTKARSARCL